MWCRDVINYDVIMLILKFIFLCFRACCIGSSCMSCYDPISMHCLQLSLQQSARFRGVSKDKSIFDFFFLSGPNGTPFLPYVSKENKT